MEKEKFEPQYKWSKNVNDSWMTAIYFTNPSAKRRHIITAAAAPGTNARIAKAMLKEELVAMAAEFLADNPGFKQVNYDAYAAQKIIRK